MKTGTETPFKFDCSSPCKTCPYRKDAKLKLWHKTEFEALLRSEKDYMGVTYGCHKKNGSVCVGWLMDQDKRFFPSIALRLEMLKQGVDRTFLDSLHCESEMYESVEDMVRANFPELLKKRKPRKNEYNREI